jgi:hypothetical protein
MPWDSSLGKDGIIVNRVRGSLDDEEVVTMIGDVYRMMVEADSTRCLSDFQEVHSEVSIQRLYQLPKIYEEMGIPRKARLAMLLPLTKHRMIDYQFYENTCQNAGYNIRLFESSDEARQWLLEG